MSNKNKKPIQNKILTSSRNLGIVEKIRKEIEAEYNKKKFDPNDFGTLYVTPPVNTELTIKEAIREVLSDSFNKESQIVLLMNDKNVVSLDDKSVELNQGAREILNFLSNYNTYINTSTIVFNVDAYSTTGSLQKAIGSINAKLILNLKLKDKVIFSKGRGYMVNPRYRIRFIK